MTDIETLNSILPDEQMRQRLKARDSLVFEGSAQSWQELERQIERLGFGEVYFVSRLQGVLGKRTKVSPACRN